MKNFRALETRSLLLVYGGLTLASLIIDGFSHHNPLWAWAQSGRPNTLWILAGGLFVLGYTGCATLLTRMFHWALEIEKVFRQILTPLSYVHIMMLSLLSGFIEEWFFRGVLVTHFGIIISSVFFGLGHFIPSASLWLWSLTSFAVGILFAFAYQSSHSLVLVALIHTSINWILLLRLNREGHRAPSLPGHS